MPGDPKQCREYALRCVEMAGQATNPDHKRLMTDLAQNWLDLAIELERTHGLLDHYPPATTNSKAATRPPQPSRTPWMT